MPCVLARACAGNSDILLLLCEASIALDGTCPDLSFAINTSMVGAHHALLPLLLQNGIISRAAYVERLHRYAQEGDAEAVVGLVEGVGLGRVGNGQPQLSQQEVAGALRLAEDVGQERVLQVCASLEHASRHVRLSLTSCHAAYAFFCQICQTRWIGPRIPTYAHYYVS